jgi:outer membrane protein OmpA-like peptidoglycan-associated protein
MALKLQLMRAAALGTTVAASLALAGPAAGQTADDVSVDLNAVGTGQSAPTPIFPPAVSGRIVLTPPPGVSPMSRAALAPIKLKPPQAMEPKAGSAATAPKPVAQKPRAPAPEPAQAPKEVREAAAPAPTPPIAQPAPMTPQAAVREQEPPATQSLSPPSPTAPKPSAAAMQTAATEPAGPANTPLARESATPTTEPQQAASLPPPDQTLPSSETSEAVSLMFSAGSAQVSGDAQVKVGDLVQRMTGDRSLRVQLLAYASDPEKNTSKARRMALDRAVSVRNMLIDAGVERTRIEVRALGDQGDAGPPDRVDAIAMKR